MHSTVHAMHSAATPSAAPGLDGPAHLAVGCLEQGQGAGRRLGQFLEHLHSSNAQQHVNPMADIVLHVPYVAVHNEAAAGRWNLRSRPAPSSATLHSVYFA